MDVDAHHIYPVFDVHRHSGVNGTFTFPDMAKNPYGSGQPPLNEFTLDHPGTLIATAGHVHPGGLYDDLDLIRPGVQPGGGAIPGTGPQLGATVPLLGALLGPARAHLLGHGDDRHGPRLAPPGQGRGHAAHQRHLRHAQGLLV